MKKSLTLVTRTQDNGDGGYTTYLYNTKEELLKDHYEMEELIEGTPEWDKKAKEILTEDAPYENGYIGSVTLEIEVAEDGSLSLSKGAYIHAGQ